MPSAVISIVGHGCVDQYCVLCFLGQKLDEDKQDAVTEVFIDQDEVLAKVCLYSSLIA